MRLLSVIIIVFMALLIMPIASYSAEVTLQWDAPITNVDGSPLSDLAGYKLYQDGVGKDIGNVTTYTVKDLPDGIYVFQVTAYDASGNESDRSNAATWTIQIPPDKVQNLSCQVLEINNCIGCVNECK